MRKSNWSEGEVLIKAVKNLFSWEIKEITAESPLQSCNCTMPIKKEM